MEDNSDLLKDVILILGESEDNELSKDVGKRKNSSLCPASHHFIFPENPGILVNFSSNLIQYFEYFFDNLMLKLIVDQTDVYVEHLYSQKYKKHSKQQKWLDLKKR